eukprot:TRINITY_DN26112_c0_g1_i1.p1 TRINITY_DN26112_c0_g1~~TRINITY_DN26112_c0_g1_i1.p1  ORF type:complete len:385 (+),score=68.66 TRINITY_DN26112_c0_g1_i1:47-1156(+)
MLLQALDGEPGLLWSRYSKLCMAGLDPWRLDPKGALPTPCKARAERQILQKSPGGGTGPANSSEDKSVKGRGDARSQLAYLLKAPSTPSPARQATPAQQREESGEEPKSDAAEGKSAALAKLGVGSASCGSCGDSQVVTERVFSELGQLYCQKCWDAWDRCGWWKPSLRVATTPPGPGPDGGLPRVSPEDAFFLPGFLCSHDDLSFMAQLQEELQAEGKDFSDWHGARHLGCHFEAGKSNAECSLRLQLVERMEQAFGIKASAVRLNLYRSNRDYKPMHYDRGRDIEGTPQLTVGASFGSVRELTLMHVRSGVTVSFPQRNGDVFAFTPEINEVFMHGVPRILQNSPSALEPEDSTRMSLIIWGARVRS